MSKKKYVLPQRGVAAACAFSLVALGAVLLLHSSLSSFSLAVARAASSTEPILSSIVAAPAGTTATITWTTDEPATTQVEYGTTTSYGIFSALDSTASTTHSVSLADLTPGTLYHVAVLSTDASGNSSTSTDQTFTTSSASSTVGEVTIAPTSGMSGSSATLSGSGFGGSEPVTIEFGSTTIATNTNAAGAFTAGVTIPSLPVGIVSITAQGAVSGTTGSTTFMVEPAATSSIGTLTVSPMSGMSGSSVTLQGSGFAASEPVTIQLGPVTLSATAASDGTFSTTFVVPSSLSVGSAVVTAQGTMSGTTGGTTFTVEPAATTSTDDFTTLQNEITQLQSEVGALQAQVQTLLTQGSSGTGGGATGGMIDQNGATMPAASTIDFGGRGFGHEEQVVVSLDGQTVTDAHADGGGNFSTGSLLLPSTPGTYTYLFTGQNSGIVGHATITVTP